MKVTPGKYQFRTKSGQWCEVVVYYRRGSQELCLDIPGKIISMSVELCLVNGCEFVRIRDD